MQSVKAPLSHSALHPILKWVGWVGKKLGGDTARTADWTNHSGIPHHVMSYSTVKTQEKKDERGKFMVMELIFPNNH